MPQRVEVPGMGVIEFPDGMSDQQIAAAIRANMGSSTPERTPAQAFMQDAVAGAIRGAGSIGSTLLAPMDALNARIMGRPAMAGNNERRADMTAALGGLGADIESIAFGAGKLGGEVAGTAGAGSALAGLLRLLPGAGKAAPLLDSIRSSGFKAGGVTGANGLGLRALGGGATGAVSAGLVNPEDVGAGAAIGAAAPAVLKGAAKIGGAVAKPFRSAQEKRVQELSDALGMDRALLAEKLKRGKTLVRGAEPTVAQIVQSPQAGLLERLVSESAGGIALKNKYAAQNTARLAALEDVAPVSATGYRDAQQDFGIAALKQIRAGDASAKAATKSAYQQIPQDEAALYLPDLAAVRDSMYSAGAVADRGFVDKVVNKATEIGNIDLPAISAAKAPAGSGKSVAQMVRNLGGISLKNNGGLRGELVGLKGDLKNLIRQNGGRSPDEMAMAMYERGYIADETPDALFEALRADARGVKGGSIYDDTSAAYRAQRDAAMGAPPGAQKVPQKVTLREFDDMRKDMGSLQREAALAGRDREAATLGKMKQAMDDRVNEVVRGDGAVDDNLPIAWADQLDAARKLKLEQVQKYRTGPQADAFLTGQDGLPKVQGGEFSAKVWGQRPGIADDIKQFRKIADENPALLNQFRGLIATQGAGTASAGGKLGDKFVKWVDASLPGLKAAFDESEVRMLRRIAADIKRANAVDAMAAAKGSSSYQNVNNALSLGLLDSPLVSMAANRIPIVGSFTGPMLDGLKTTAATKKAKEFAGLLSSPEEAVLAIDQAMNRGNRFLGLQRGLLLSAPVVGAQ